MPLRVEPVRDRKLYRLIKAGPTRSTRKGEMIFRQGEPGEVVSLVQDGHVGLRLGRTGAPDRTVALAGPWELPAHLPTHPGHLSRGQGEGPAAAPDVGHGLAGTDGARVWPA